MPNIVLILYTKVEPLMITSCIGICAHIQMEITHLRLNYSVEVPTLEIGLKDVRLAPKVQLPQEGITFHIWVHSYECSMLSFWETCFLT